MAGPAKLRALRRGVALAAACLLVGAASAGAETAPGAEPVAEPAAVGDATTVATGQIVTLVEGIGVGDGTAPVAGERVSLGEGVSVADGHETASGQLVALGEAVAVDDGTGTTTGQVVDLSEGVAVSDGTDAEAENVRPAVQLGPLAGLEGSPTAGSGSFTDPDPQTWTATVEYGDGSPAEPLALAADKTFALEHVYDDDGAYVVTVTVTDTNGATGTATAPVAIENVAPEAVLGGAAGDEGAPIAVTFSDQTDASNADAAAGFTYRYACDGATLGPETPDPTAACTFDDDGAYTVLARIADKDGGSTDYTAEVAVGNVAPTGDLASDGPVAEGSPATVSWSGQTDPSAADTAAGFTYRYACDGVTLGPETTDASTTCAFDDGPATHTVLARIADKDGGFSDRTTEVVVENAPPDGGLANGGPVAEGGTATISWSGQGDPSAADASAGFTYRYACDGATLGPETADPTTTCSFDDGPGSYSVLARITDKDGGSTDRTTAVTVTNLAPTATLGNAGPVAEGSPVEIAFADQADASAADTAAGFTYRYACDGVTLGAPTADPAAACVFDDGPSTRTVLARITDKDGGFTDLTTEVEVTNVAPTATLVTPAAPVAEGSTFELALADAFDPSSADTAAGLTLELDCGTGAGFGASSTCTALDDPSQAVRARVADKDGGETVYEATVAVANVAPSAEITGPPAGSVYAVGEPVTFTGTFADAGVLDTHAAGWTLGAASVPGTVSESGGSGTTTLVHSFAAAGIYSVALTVTDDDGGSATATTVAGEPAHVIVFDPAGGSVTGGGWIAASGAPSGKASFGFNARYTPNGGAPSGNTELKLPGGDFAFKATRYDWLVVSGSTAVYGGEGTVNGAGGHTFVLTAEDGSPDRIRLQVRDASGAVVHDTGPDLRALGGGSIVVHRR